ncbi:Two-component system sensor histidine kinase [hydrothermal vent metagenome]|uniref:histidine kinase n=1 Tax=hydrothermal vent metagenome TaxID=652676 RepID=A0A3B0ZN47_9ZZZZ
MKGRNQTSPTNIVDARVYGKAVDYLYQNLPTTMLAQSAMPVFIFAVLWSSSDHLVLSIWTAFNILFCLVDFLLYRSYKKKRSTIINLRRWGNYYAINSFAMGVLNGVAVFLFFSPDSVPIQIFLITVILGYSAGAMVMNAYWIMSSYTLAIPVLVIAAIRFFIEGGIQNIGVSVLLMLYLVSVITYSQNIFRSVLETIQLQFKISDLSKKYLQQKELAEKSNIEKSRFLAAASHDLRQPLNTLSLSVGLLDNLKLDKNSQAIVDVMNKSLTAMDGMFGALLDISKLEAGIIIPFSQHCRLDNIIMLIINENTPTANNKNIDIQYQQCNLIAYSDPSLLESIIRNLVSNAVRYTNEGTVNILTSVTDNFIKLSIIDTGIGIDSTEKNKIFNEYYQVHNPERDRSKGIGLGLSIVKSLVNLLKLEMDFNSELGVGTQVTLIIPLGHEVKISNNIYSKSVNLDNVYIAVIDDDEDICQAMKLLLLGWGCNVVTGENASVILKKCNSIPMVIIADYRLRENKTGGQAIKDLNKSFNKNIPAIIITGDTGVDRLHEAKDEGYILLHKPVSVPKLRASLNTVLRLS